MGGNDLQALEDRMRAQLKKRRALHVKEKDLLMKAFVDAGAAVPEKGKAAIGPRWSATEAARIRTGEFCAAWAKLGVRVEATEAAALFNKYGQDSKGLLPCKVFVEALLVGRSRLLARVGAVKDGAFEAGKSGEALGKIRYPQSRKGVYAPSDWDPQQAVQSSSALPTGNSIWNTCTDIRGSRTLPTTFSITRRGGLSTTLRGWASCTIRLRTRSATFGGMTMIFAAWQ